MTVLIKLKNHIIFVYYYIPIHIYKLYVMLRSHRSIKKKLVKLVNDLC